MSTDRYLTYRGDIRALAADGEGVVFVTVHPESLPAAVCRLTGAKLDLSAEPLPAGGQALLPAADGLWVGGTDRRIYFLPARGGAAAARGPELAAAPVALAALAGERLAVAAGPQVAILARADGRLAQTLDLPEETTCLAADPTGQWLAVGTTRGTVAVFECETDAASFQLSDAQPLHEAAVTALLFEADDLRFLSAGADQKLLSTHARGRLEAEDRGRGAVHAEPITALIAGPAERFLSGSSDSTIKSWPRGRGTRPVTLQDGLGKVTGLAVVSIHGKPQVVAACQDNTLRFFHLDEEGKFGEAATTIHGAADWAKHELGQADPRRREAALRTLAGFNDAVAIKRIAAQMKQDPDHGLRLLACELLGQSSHPRATQALEKALGHREEAVRLAAFDGLRRTAGPRDLRPLRLALRAAKADVGQRAVQALEELAATDGPARAQLVEALRADPAEVRRAALTSLEQVVGPESPAASLTALEEGHADLHRLALVRLFQRRLLHDPRVQATLRWRLDDTNAEVRRIAYLLSLHTRENLLTVLRQRDPELQRQLTELESGTLPSLEEAGAGEPGRIEEIPVPSAVGQPPDLDTLLLHLDELVREGKLPADLLQNLHKGGQGGNIFSHIVAQIQALSSMEDRPQEEDE